MPTPSSACLHGAAQRPAVQSKPRRRQSFSAPLPITTPDPWMDKKLFAGKSAPEREHLFSLNKNCAMVFVATHLRVMWRPDPGTPYMFISVRDARMREANRVVVIKGGSGGTKKLKMFDEWLASVDRRQYNSVKFAPGVDDPRIYNLFEGWAVPAVKGDWSILRDHLRLVICQNNNEQYDWMMAWLAQMFQNPGEKIPVGVVIRGLKGTGKSIVFDFIQRLMPRYFYKVADGNRALGNFNAHYESTIMLVMEEAFWAGNQAKESVLKDLITSPSLVVERKGIDPYMATNHMRVAMISNERWVVPATHDERRFAVFDCGDQHRGDFAYFDAMSDQMKSGGLEAMLYDLLHYEPENGWKLLRQPPATSGLREQIVDSLRGIDAFMYGLIANGLYECDGCDDEGIFLSEKHETPVSLKNLRIAVQDYLSDQVGTQKAANFERIERAVREWSAASIELRPVNKNKVKWAVFPSLVECRQHLRRIKGFDLAAPSIN